MEAVGPSTPSPDDMGALPATSSMVGRGRRGRRSHPGHANAHAHAHGHRGDSASEANYAQPTHEYMKQVRRKAAERLSFRWRFLGTFGLCCLVAAAVTLGLLAKLEGGFGVHEDSEQPDVYQDSTPPWFKSHLPAILSSYATSHNKLVHGMYSKNSLFLVHEIPVNSSSVHDSFLGLVSSFMLAIVTDRALLVQWTDDWLTPMPTTDLSQLSSGYTFNASVDSRRVRLSDVFDKPGFEWDYDTFMDRYTRDSRDDEPELYAWDPLYRINDLTCKNLGDHLKAHKFVKITNQDYFMPLIQMNPHYSDWLETELTLTKSFADLFNFLLRPSAPVLESIERFKARYMDGNRVIGMEMSVEKSRGDWTGDDAMPDAQQNLFISHAGQLIKETDDQVAPDSTEGVVFMLVTDNHGQLQSKFEELEASDNNAITAGVVAILAPTGHGVSRVMLEIQELWLLGYAEYIMTTPGSRIGILGAARTHKAPLVVIDESTVHQSTAAYPCLANYRAVEQTTCFVPSMLLKVPADNAVPCG